CCIGLVVYRWTPLAAAEVGGPGSDRQTVEHQPPASANRSFPEPELVAKDPAGHGVLGRLEGKTILIVHGTPAQMGRAHGTLLAEKARILTTRVLYSVGGLDTIQSGRWFLDLMEEIHRRTGPFVPKRFFEEIDAASQAAGISVRDGRLANLFPERFHCSGVAVRGKASRDGRVYHGRVLDYMRDIHLQRAAVVQVFIPDGYNTWMSLGYAGFLGTVTCMNERGLAIGEMGGRGEGDWDGMPMTFLMRDIMERASTVEEALEIFRKTPRTCEYYYVLSDKHRDMAAVRATPKELLVLRPGQQHPLLPHVPEDTVFISGDTRAQVLSQRLQEHYGKIDVERMIQIIKRPVAMASNLHNAIFSPETLEMWVADAGRDTPACDEPYVRVSLPELVQWYRKVNKLSEGQKNPISGKFLRDMPQNLSEDFASGRDPESRCLINIQAGEQSLPSPSPGLEAVLKGRFSWQIGPPLVEPVQPEGDVCYSVKDPSIVFHNGRWHLFCTVRGQKRSHQIEYLSFADWKEANGARRIRLENHEGFFCAPQVFYFTPHKKWYLICQASDPAWNPKYGAAFATTENLADPASWTGLRLLGAKPADGKAGL
ncbi:MAG TPA: C45 family autoproteolytic acyltransferase/hydrolase, partial [Thermoguttaceae bacterium]|nr:C45 family autoproteolytic acyltransferase/hydrolase [Thermoguttaceae bacterium]